MFFLSTVVLAQNKLQEITVVYFRELSQDDLNKITEFKKLLNPQNKKDKYKVILKNFYTESSVTFTNESDLYYLEKSIVNKVYNDEKDVIDKIKNFNALNILSFSSDLNFNPSLKDIGIFSNELRRLTKNTKKIKENVLIVWFNGFLPNKLSTENFKVIYEQNKKNGTISQLIPNITNIKPLTRVIPVSDNYNFVFEPIEYYNSYQVLLTFYDVETGNDLEIFNEIVDIYKNNKDFKLTREIGTNRFILSINNKFLGYKCYSLLKITDSGKIEGPNGCDECKDECLYNKEFSLSIRGHVNNFNSEDLWSSKIQPIFLQCTVGK